MGQCKRDAGGLCDRQLFCCAPGDGAGGVLHGGQPFRETGIDGKAYKGCAAFRAVKGSGKPYQGEYF